MNIDNIYQQIIKYEKQFKQDDFDSKSIFSYAQFCVMLGWHQRLFNTLVANEFYKKPKTYDSFFNICRIYGQKNIYYRYMPDYLITYMVNLLRQNTPYEIWGSFIKAWFQINCKFHIGTFAVEDINTLGLHFIATIATLQHQEDKNRLNEILCHPIYHKAIPIYQRFMQQPNINDINQIYDICFDHIKKVRKNNNFNDPWIKFYDDYLYSQEYQTFIAPYHQYMDTHNIDYKDKLIFCMLKDKNIGDNYHYVNAIINWSLVHNVRLIALLTPSQAQWIGLYYKDYFDYIIIRNADANIPYILQTLYPAPNRTICLQLISQDTPPYYYPRTTKCHFNHYTHDELYDANADVGTAVTISSISDDIKFDNHQLLKQFNPKDVILISPHSNADNTASGSNFLLRNFWNILIKKIKKQGFVPIINLSYPDEQHYIEDVISCHLPLTHVIDFVDNIRGFIGLRSGLCDLLISSNNRKKYCVYPIEYIDWCNDLAPWYYLVHFRFDDIERHVDDIIDSLNDKYVSTLENHQCYGYSKIPDYSPTNH